MKFLKATASAALVLILGGAALTGGFKYYQAKTSPRQTVRAEGARVGYIRPKTVSPFPYETFEKLDYSRVKAILDVEMSIPALMKLDVELAVKDRTRIETCLHAGGEIMSSREVEAAIRALLQGGRTE